jgi:hypothetical protein
MQLTDGGKTFAPLLSLGKDWPFFSLPGGGAASSASKGRC